MADWYYIGHYGQLGPLTLEQIEELIQGGVIVRETYVWATGMPQWLQADSVMELKSGFQSGVALAPPPPPSGSGVPFPAPPPAGASSGSQLIQPYGTDYFTSHAGYSPASLGAKSDKSRVAAGVLNLILPGVGRMYLGYAAIGVLQLFVSIITCGIGALWPLIDGILMLTGSVKYDGYGRVLTD